MTYWIKILIISISISTKKKFVGDKLEESMLNNNIGIDLHIHSKSSEYKEEGLYCIKKCTIENLDILFSKLSENNVNMFSITDHNRFDKDLYIAMDKLIKENKYPTVMSVLAGVEFDVLIDEKKPGCHIIVIFDANCAEDYQKIVDGINKDMLYKKDESYTINRFLSILRDINLNTILIAHQKSAFHNQGNHKSLGDATDYPEKYLCYIDALEYNKSRTEGIVRDSLEKYETQIGLIKGSDCHDWEYYPKHDKNANAEKYTLRIRALPTFKGLLMALSSPDTRFNRSDEQEDKRIINNIKINGSIINFSSGINAIIGENGSGKSSILKILKREKYKYLISIQRDSQIECNEYFNEKTTYIEQSQLVTLNNDNKLFKNEDYYKTIDLTTFNRAWIKYNKDLQRYLKQHIEIEKLKESLLKKKITLRSFDATYFYINFVIDADFTKVDNPYLEHLSQLTEIMRLLKSEFEAKDIYSPEQLDILSNAYKELGVIKSQIYIKSNNIETDKKVRSIIYAKINEYKTVYDVKQTTASRDKAMYTDSVRDFANAITEIYKKQTKLREYPEYPKPMQLAQTNTENGFTFVNQSEYSDLDLNSKYLGMIFNKDYRSDEKLQSIRTTDELAKAITSADSKNYEEKWQINFEKFLDGAKKEKRHMYSADESRLGLLSDGSTLGELSLAYYQFITYNKNDIDLLVIDQPEDNISNTNIANHLIKFLNRLRDKVQIIFVTHNPLLVVNLDVDNVICLYKHNGKITAQGGCLEHGEILKCVSSNMDGGKEKIEKRLRIYG